MSPRERALSALFVAVLVLPVAEAGLRLEAWPLTAVPMFSQRIPPDVPVRHVTLVGTMANGATRELGPRHFGLTPDELARRLPPDVRWLGRECGGLGRAYNARQPVPARRLTVLRAHVDVKARPGAPPPAVPHWTVDCALGAR
jgi:hypothetical protein